MTTWKKVMSNLSTTLLQQPLLPHPRLPLQFYGQILIILNIAETEDYVYLGVESLRVYFMYGVLSKKLRITSSFTMTWFSNMFPLVLYIVAASLTW